MSPETHPITIWGGGTTRTFRPVYTAEELGLSYVHRPIGARTGETRTPEYTALNPKHKIPYLQDGDFGLSESVAICRYLVENYGAGAGFYLPETTQARARQDEWVSYFYGELDETSLYVMRRHGDLNEIYGEAPAAVSAAREYAAKHLGITEHHLRSSAFVMGERFGLADIVLVSCLDWAFFYGLELPGSLPDYRARIAERPAYQRAFAANYPKLAATDQASE